MHPLLMGVYSRQEMKKSIIASCCHSMKELRPGTINSLVRFSADSKFKGPPKEKNHCFHFIFLLPPDSWHIFGPTRPTEVVHLSKSAVFH